MVEMDERNRRMRGRRGWAWECGRRNCKCVARGAGGVMGWGMVREGEIQKMAEVSCRGGHGFLLRSGRPFSRFVWEKRVVFFD